MNYTLSGFGRENKDKLKGLVPGYMLNRQDVDFLIAIGESGRLLGILCYSLSEGVAEILYVNVLPFARLQGLCTGLIRGFLDRIDEMRLPFPVTAVWDETSDAVMGRIIRGISGFAVSSTPAFFRVSPEDIASSEFCKKVGSKEYGAKSWGELSPNVKKKVYKKLSDMGFEPFVNGKEEFLPDLSNLYMEGDEVQAAVFFKRPEDKTIELAFIWSDGKSQKAIAAVIGTGIRKASENYNDCYVEFTGISDSILKQAENVFPGVKPEYIYRAIRFGEV